MSSLSNWNPLFPPIKSEKKSTWKLKNDLQSINQSINQSNIQIQTINTKYYRLKTTRQVTDKKKHSKQTAWGLLWLANGGLDKPKKKINMERTRNFVIRTENLYHYSALPSKKFNRTCCPLFSLFINSLGVVSGTLHTSTRGCDMNYYFLTTLSIIIPLPLLHREKAFPRMSAKRITGRF